MEAKNWLGQRVGRLLVLEKLASIRRGAIRWKVKCDCGKERAVDSAHLAVSLTGKYNVEPSCGCAWREKLSKMRKSHGFTSNGKVRSEYSTWRTMFARCENPNCASFPRYGGRKERPIRVCERWQESFENFIADMGEKPEPKRKYSIERRDNDGDYCPENCYWATALEQNRNRSNNFKITHNGVTKILLDWANELGVAPGVLAGRIKRGWSLEKALSSDRHNEKPMTMNGETMSITKWCQRYGVSIQVVSGRLKQGWSFIDALTKSKYAGKRAMFATMDGETKSIRDWAIQYNVPLQRVRLRVKMGWSISDALKLPVGANNNGPKKNRLAPVTINGETKRVSEWAKINGLSISCVTTRIAMGMSPEAAVTIPQKIIHKKS